MYPSISPFSVGEGSVPDKLTRGSMNLIVILQADFVKVSMVVLLHFTLQLPHLHDNVNNSGNSFMKSFIKGREESESDTIFPVIEISRLSKSISSLST